MRKMLTYVISDVISFFVTGKCQKILTLEDTFKKNTHGRAQINSHSPPCYLRVQRIFFKLYGVLRLESDSYIFYFLKPDAL